jgi:hypothetical protein
MSWSDRRRAPDVVATVFPLEAFHREFFFAFGITKTKFVSKRGAMDRGAGKAGDRARESTVS